MFVCIYVVIYFRAWYDGCGHENVRIFPGSAHDSDRSVLPCYPLNKKWVMCLFITKNLVIQENGIGIVCVLSAVNLKFAK